MNNKKPWTDDLRDRLSQYEAKNVPLGLWNDIANALDAKKGRVLPWRIIAGVAASVLAICGVGILWNNTAANKEQPMAAKTQKAVDTPAATAIKEHIEESALHTAAAANWVANNTVLAMRNERAIGGGIAEGGREYADVASKDATESAGNAVPDKETTKSIVVKEDVKGSKMLAEHSDFVNGGQGGASRNVSLSLYASNIMYASNSIDGWKMQPVHMLMSDVSGLSPLSSPINAVAYSNRNEISTTSIKHRQPISIGVGVRYFFSRRWAVESGVSYMMLGSEMKSGTDHSYVYTDESVRYIGVPLAVGYQWIDAKRLSVYSNVGVQAHFGVSGNQECQYVVDDKPINEPTKSSIGNIPVQWTLTAAAGVQYNVLGNIGIYAEPGVAYYIDNGSSLQTSYSDKKLPLTFNLRIGLRYDFGK